MSDLISREVCIKVLQEHCDKHKQYALHIDEISDIITNAPVVSGEVVAYERFSDGEKKWISVAFEDLAHYKSKGQKIRELYTTPQQPQSVSDALEEVADVISRTLNTMWRAHTPREGAKIISDLQKMLKAIRALIKRNEVNHTMTDDKAFHLADKVIDEAYPDFNNKGFGWWGDERIPNHGMLRGAIAKAIIQTLRAKVASAEVLVEALREIGKGVSSNAEACLIADDALATYEKLSEGT